MDTENNLTFNKKVALRFAKKMAFSKFVQTKKRERKEDEDTGWTCCGANFTDIKGIQCHVSKSHKVELNELSEKIFEEGDDLSNYTPLRKKQRQNTSDGIHLKDSLPEMFCDGDEYPWLPKYVCNNIEEAGSLTDGKIILFYCYRDIHATEHVKCWQETLCKRLSLSGKVRVAQEGLNATVGGHPDAIDVYIEAVMKHPLFDHMTQDDFKMSNGSASDFPDGLKVGIYKEAVPMGIDTNAVSYSDAGRHLTPEEFHRAIQDHQQEPEKSVFIDCRNFYESKIGNFQGAVCPDIRKFSYWPEYVDQNKELFQDKKVYMYCTGGIRCERGSAYLKAKGLGEEVFQLKGGIHKYIEKYPDGYFRGKMFVFDNRYHLKANEDVLSRCRYCNAAFDEYQPCSSTHCHQLVLSCYACRAQELTACCKTCQMNNAAGKKREECECTVQRARVPQEQRPNCSDKVCEVHKTGQL